VSLDSGGVLSLDSFNFVLSQQHTWPYGILGLARYNYFYIYQPDAYYNRLH
jgi:hypothetical protein